jgi:hypothetical protein
VEILQHLDPSPGQGDLAFHLSALFATCRAQRGFGQTLKHDASFKKWGIAPGRGLPRHGKNSLPEGNAESGSSRKAIGVFRKPGENWLFGIPDPIRQGR